jgi:hypothetical protein
MIIHSLGLVLLLIPGAPWQQQHWVGRLSIGSGIYAVAAETTATDDGTVRFSITLSSPNGAAVRSLVAVLGQKTAEIAFDGGKSRPLSPEIAFEWRRQLMPWFAPTATATDYDCRTVITEKVCDSRTLVALDDSLSGRLRLIYNGERLTAIRFFSLAEWTNPFQEYVSLSLDIR